MTDQVAAADFSARASGRVNLIGEHTDYNGGMVLPAALSVGLEVTLSPCPEQTANIESTGHDETVMRPLSEPASGHWSDTALGALREAQSLGLLDGGARLSIRSTIPAGSGLSSSAALIVAILKAARDAHGSGPNDVDLAIAARRVENDFIGVPCGIMDQMAVALATPGTAMALDTKSLDYSLVDLPADHAMVVVHSGVTRKLTEGRYKERKLECDEAKQHFGTDDLCLLDPAVIENSSLTGGAKLRAHHCATEHLRVLSAVEAIMAGDVAQLGRLMNESHVSMRDFFEMSLPPIDALVDSAVDLGAAGARLTGGGFGGCIVACVANEKREDWLGELLSQHPDARFIDAVSSRLA
ncbi:MAG: galactokinase [Erythrobacter sp.]